MPIGWDELEEFAREAADDVAASGMLVAPVFVAYDELGPFGVMTLTDLPETAELVRTCVDLFAPLRPSRFAAVWQLLFEVPEPDPECVSDDGFVHGLRIVRGVADGPSGSLWTSTVHGYRRTGGRVVAWADEQLVQPLDEVPCTLARGLRPILDEGDHRWLTTPLLEVPGPPYQVHLRPGYLAGCRRLDEDEYVRSGGRLFPRAATS